MSVDKIILVCTNNLVPTRIFERVLETAFSQASARLNIGVVVVSHFPIFTKHVVTVDLPEVPYERHEQFDSLFVKESKVNPDEFSCPYMNICVGEREYSLHTIVQQMMCAIKMYDAYYIIMEHDVFYPMDYVSKMLCYVDLSYDFLFWQNTVFLTDSGFFDCGMYALSRFAGQQRAWMRFLESKLRQDGFTSVEPVLKGMEPLILSPDEIVFDKYKIIEDGAPTLDIKHGFNTTGMILASNPRKEDAYWGKADLWLGYIDQEWLEAKQRMSMYGYGLLM